MLLEHSNGYRLRGISAVGNGDAGIRIWSSPHTSLRASHVTGSSDSGIRVQDASRNLIARNTANHNGGRGIEVSAEAQVAHNRTHLN